MSSNLPKVMSMQGGDHQGSYALHSTVQNYTFHAFVKTHLSHLMHQHFQHLVSSLRSGRPICIADFGCAHGRNTLDYAQFVVEIIRSRYSSDGLPAPQIHYFFCDLPSNDFNSLFGLLAKENMIDKENVAKENTIDKENVEEARRSYFASGVPGSFYGRLFPEGSLHLGVSAYSLQWLSQIPPSILDKDSPSWNGEHSWINGDRPAVAEAFAEQFKKDLTKFLKCRAKELANGALLYVLVLGRPVMDRARENYGQNFPWDKEFEATWADMVCEGLVAANLRDTFNIPMYPPSTSEFEEVVKTVPELRLLELKLVEEVPPLPTQEMDILETDAKALAKLFAGIVKSLMNPLIEAHIGMELSKCFFHRLERKLEESARLAGKAKRPALNIVSALLTRT